jgi:hypothetical protein
MYLLVPLITVIRCYFAQVWGFLLFKFKVILLFKVKVILVFKVMLTLIQGQTMVRYRHC